MSITLPPAMPREGQSLLIGVWVPGTDTVDTVATDLSHLAAIQKQFADEDSEKTYRPSYQCDFMLLESGKKYDRIVFHGCCPVAAAMGASDCGDPYPSEIDPLAIAKKVNGLISEKGGLVFFRHCVPAARPEGIDRQKREEFIRIFQGEGFEVVDPSDTLYRSGPGSDIEDPHPLVAGKWKAKNGGLILYKPPHKPPR